MILSRLPRLSRTMLCVLALLGTPAAALASQIMVDEKIGQALLSNSGDETELAELRTLTGLGNLVLGNKVDVTRRTPVSLAEDQASTWFITDLTEPGYFALKFGTGSTGAGADTFFFKNVGEMHLLVWSNDLVLSLTGWVCNQNDATKCHVERLSHYITSPAVQLPAKDPGQKETEGGGLEQQREVPEPGSLALLAMGALAVYGSRRRAR